MCHAFEHSTLSSYKELGANNPGSSIFFTVLKVIHVYFSGFKGNIDDCSDDCSLPV